MKHQKHLPGYLTSFTWSIRSSMEKQHLKWNCCSTLFIYSQDIAMELGLDKCATLTINGEKYWKLKELRDLYMDICALEVHMFWIWRYESSIENVAHSDICITRAQQTYQPKLIKEFLVIAATCSSTTSLESQRSTKIMWICSFGEVLPHEEPKLVLS